MKQKEEIDPVTKKILNLDLNKAKGKTIELLPKVGVVRRWEGRIPEEIEKRISVLDPDTAWLIREYRQIQIEWEEGILCDISGTYLLNEKIPPDKVQIGIGEESCHLIVVQKRKPFLQLLLQRRFLFWQLAPKILEEYPSVYHMLLSYMLNELFIKYGEEDSIYNKVLDWVWRKEERCPF